MIEVKEIKEYTHEPESNKYFSNLVRVLKAADGSIWFLAQDVTNLFGYRAGRNHIRNYVEDADKDKARIKYGGIWKGAYREMTVINIHAVEVLGKRCRRKIGPGRLEWIEGIAKDALKEENKAEKPEKKKLNPKVSGKTVVINLPEDWEQIVINIVK